MIITFASPKGGAGKTTSIVTAAVELARRGNSVLCLDCDQENFLYKWAGRRDEQVEDGAEIPKVVVKNCAMLGQVTEKIEKYAEKYDYIFIDTPGFDSGSNRDAILASHLVVFPSKPGGFDIDSIPKINALSAQAAQIRPDIQCYLMPVDLDTNASRIETDLDFFEGIAERLEHVHLFPAYTQHRSAYIDASKMGLGPQEMNNAKATAESKEIGDGIQEIENALIDALEGAE
ncbi:MAG: hypothetical protein CMB99_16255 [Flavobacteriaceae bacterium]|nr:hypothetical protein [Flavobacteriaceae bacterium]|tara:strand:+ start:10868 stop:11563 length:696 start_codon:yes stop_codon:yes gene_type:complete